MGGKKKKGLANRLAKMSDEERARYLQHRADIEEENRRRKEQLISAYLKNKLKKEDGFARLNVAKINQNWHLIMRRQKCKEMKDEVQYLMTYMERLLSLKDRTIQKLLDELEDAEEQYRHNFQTHLLHIDRMIDFGNKSIVDMKEEFESERVEMIKESEEERKKFIKNAFEEEANLKTIIYQQDQVAVKELKESYEYYFQRNDDVMREQRKEFEEMRRSKELQVGDLWRQIASLLREHVEHTDTKRAHLCELQLLDANSAAEIRRNEELIKQQEAEIERLEAEFETIKVCSGEQMKVLEGAERMFRQDFMLAKRALQQDLKKDETNLLHLTTISKSVLEELGSFKLKGERILQLISVCRKFETAEEQQNRFTGGEAIHTHYSELPEDTKEPPYPSPPSTKRPLTSSSSSTTPKPELTLKKRRHSSRSSEISFDSDKSNEGVLQDCFKTVAQLEGLWTSYSKVYVNCCNIEDEKKVLNGEIEELKVTIKNLLETAALEKVAARVQGPEEVMYIRNVHSADRIFGFKNVKVPVK